MALKEIQVGDQTILVEVSDLFVQGGAAGAAGGRFQETAASEAVPEDIGERVSGLVRAMTAPIQQALKTAEAAEWTLELTLGFKGESGIPFIAKGEANGAVKVTAKWTKG